MKAHRQHILDKLSDCDGRARAMFALLCAERLRSCCWALQAGHGAHLGACFTHMDALFELLQSHQAPDPAMLRATFEEIEPIVPGGGEPLCVQAQSGVICLLGAIEAFAGRTRVTITDVVNAIVDALNNYEFFIRRRIMNDTSSPTEYPLLQREIERQLADVAFVRGLEQSDKSRVVEYRLENLQFTVPLAV